MRREIRTPIVRAVILNAAFLITELILLKLGAFDGCYRLYLVDIPIRLITGAIALFLISRTEDLRRLMTNMIPARTFIFLIPIFTYFILQLSQILFATGTGYPDPLLYLLNCAQQIATGFFEESIRVLLMIGMLKYWIDSPRGRIRTILITGLAFGLSHSLNFLFNESVLSCLLQVISCCLWGMFMGAVFMYSKNLTLLMLIHAVWDIVVRIPGAFFVLPQDSTPLLVLGIGGYIIDYLVLTIFAFYIAKKEFADTSPLSVMN